jgi:hypothetical protein
MTDFWYKNSEIIILEIIDDIFSILYQVNGFLNFYIIN